MVTFFAMESCLIFGSEKLKFMVQLRNGAVEEKNTPYSAATGFGQIVLSSNSVPLANVPTVARSMNPIVHGSKQCMKSVCPRVPHHGRRRLIR